VKRLALLSIWLALPLVACKTVNTPLPAWAPNVQIATVGSVISSAHAVVVGYEQDQVDCAAQPALTKCPGVANPGIHAAVSAIQKALTIAQPEFDTWEKAVVANPTAVEPADLAAAISTIQTTLAQLPALTGK
jgi:hypothetical protein